jgi:hypothetical protein
MIKHARVAAVPFMHTPSPEAGRIELANRLREILRDPKTIFGEAVEIHKAAKMNMITLGRRC